jgi:hypothetical protein
MGITYGYEVQTENDPFVSTVAELVGILEKGMSSERSAILSAFPFRKLTTISSGVANFHSRTYPCMVSRCEVQARRVALEEVGPRGTRCALRVCESRDRDYPLDFRGSILVDLNLGGWNCFAIFSVRLLESSGREE